MILKTEDEIVSQVLCDRHTSANDFKIQVTKYEAVKLTLAHKFVDR